MQIGANESDFAQHEVHLSHNTRDAIAKIGIDRVPVLGAAFDMLKFQVTLI